ncbi:protein of unknown function [Methylocaldum szegediense]|uniref:Uncharacterized protein n=1 Tax=Methylocaldum szegediense TaxID=73780 RepID=A0ABM9I2X7_9GAMM|nr:protein of unknown function [Methylocaldum szegediense]
MMFTRMPNGISPELAKIRRLTFKNASCARKQEFENLASDVAIVPSPEAKRGVLYSFPTSGKLSVG